MIKVLNAKHWWAFSASDNIWCPLSLEVSEWQGITRSEQSVSVLLLPTLSAPPPLEGYDPAVISARPHCVRQRSPGTQQPHTWAVTVCKDGLEDRSGTPPHPWWHRGRGQSNKERIRNKTWEINLTRRWFPGSAYRCACLFLFTLAQNQMFASRKSWWKKWSTAWKALLYWQEIFCETGSTCIQAVLVSAEESGEALSVFMYALDLINWSSTCARKDNFSH